MTNHRLVSGRGIGKRLQVPSFSFALQGHHQLFSTDFDSGKIKLVHNTLLGLGCCCGSPTLSPLQSSLQIQASRKAGPQILLGLGEEGGGPIYLTGSRHGAGPQRRSAYPPKQQTINLEVS